MSRIFRKFGLKNAFVVTRLFGGLHILRAHFNVTCSLTDHRSRNVIRIASVVIDLSIFTHDAEYCNFIRRPNQSRRPENALVVEISVLVVLLKGTSVLK